jgi:hypothetical protein
MGLARVGHSNKGYSGSHDSDGHRGGRGYYANYTGGMRPLLRF